VKRFALGIVASTVLAVSAFSAPTFAANGASQKAPLYAVACSSDVVLTDQPVGGQVNIVTPGGQQVLNVNGSAVGLDADSSYDVWMRDLRPGYTGPSLDSSYAAVYGYYKLVTFTTDASGAGEFHIGFSKNVLAAGTYKLQVAINKAGNVDCTEQATQKDIPVQVG
jgi:hypothetical protein